MLSLTAQLIGVALGVILAAFVPRAAPVASAEEPVTGPTPVEFFVSPQGKDTWSGRLAEPAGKDGPFATLERARDALREAKKAGRCSGGGTVWLKSGIYELHRTFTLRFEDSGTAEAPVIYRAAPGEDVRIRGGKQLPITAFKPVTDAAALARLDPAARGNVVQASLTSLGIKDFGQLTRRGGIERLTHPGALELFFNDRPMPPARWPNDGYAKIAAVPEGPRGTRFIYEGDRPKRWSKAEDIWVHGYMNRPWCDTYERVAAIDSRKREVTTAEPHDYRGYVAGQRYYFLNILEELDKPGEWYLDRNRGILYFWPPESLEDGSVTVSMLETPLVVMRGTEYVTLRNLILECTRGSGVEMTGCHKSLLAGCTLRNIGTTAVAIGGAVRDLERRLYRDTTFKGDAGTENGVLSCDIYDVGECGIILGGGDRKTLEPGRNYAINNHLHDFARWVRTYRPAIFLYGVGNHAAHNLMHDAPHTAILLNGNDHLIECNEIYRVCLETSDAGAFYLGRDYTERGNAVRYNYFHHLGSMADVQAIYLDDCAGGVTVFGNICYKAGRGVLVGGGRNNIIANNIFIDCTPAVHVDARGLGWAKFWFNGRDPTLMDRLKAVHHDQPPYSTRYPELVTLLKDEPAVPKGNQILYNIRVGGRWLDLADGLTDKVVTIRDNWTEGDPGFVAPEKGDFRLRDDSPALKLGFKPIPIQKIGLYQDAYRVLPEK